MNSALLKKYLGVPLVIQLKQPLVGVFVKVQEKAPHFSDKATAQWIPQPATSEKGTEATQILQMAVISEIDDAMGCCEVQWMSIAQNPRSIIATLMDLDNIAAVTRVVSVAELDPPSLIIKG
jgi:hypothetical protein